MSNRLDEQAAWDLLRGIPKIIQSSKFPLRANHPSNSALWIQIEANGTWKCPLSVTEKAKDLLEIFLPLQLKPDLIIAQIGQTLDGYIATSTGHSHYITGPEDITRLHRLRAIVDAVVVGAETASADNPLLTVRKIQGDNPIRVVLDPHGRLDRQLSVFTDKSARTLTIQCSKSTEDTDQLNKNGEKILLPAGDSSNPPKTFPESLLFEPAQIVEALKQRGIRRILVEGGSKTVSSFLKAGILDRLHVTVSPLLIGAGRKALTLNPIDSLDKAIKPKVRHFVLDDDVLFDLDFQRTKTRLPEG